MYYSKDIESFNTDLKRITDACKHETIHVEFKLLKKSFAVIFHRPNKQFPTTKNKQCDVRNDVRNKMEQTVLLAIAKNPETTAMQITTLLAKSHRTAQRYLDNLQKRKLYNHWPTKNGYWKVN